METYLPTREDALILFKEYNESESLLKHALSVEAVMRHFAKKHSEDEEKWGVIGLVHDLDYEKFPLQHCVITKKILQAHNWPQEYIRAVLSHAWGVCTDLKPESLLEKTLYAVDELTGLVMASALVRPSKSILDLKTKSVKKKWKDKRFAAGVDRSVIEKGAEMIGMEISDLITETIEGMKVVSKEIGLAGTIK